jgi:hypothetical protein
MSTTVQPEGPFTDEEINDAIMSALNRLAVATEEVVAAAEQEGIRIKLRGRDFIVRIHGLRDHLKSSPARLQDA